MKRSQPSCILTILDTYNHIVLETLHFRKLDLAMSEINKPRKERIEIRVLVVMASLAVIPIAQPLGQSSRVRQMRCIKQFCNKRDSTFYAPKNKLGKDGV